MVPFFLAYDTSSSLHRRRNIAAYPVAPGWVPGKVTQAFAQSDFQGQYTEQLPDLPDLPGTYPAPPPG